MELRDKLKEEIDGFRFDQEWVSSRAEDFPEHKGAGCGCGVCQKMDGLNSKAIDAILTIFEEALPEETSLIVSSVLNASEDRNWGKTEGYNQAIEEVKDIITKAKGK